MTDSTHRQVEHLKALLDEQGINQSRLGEIAGASAQAASSWLSGKHAIREKYAKNINKEFPQYSTEWIRGLVDYRNEDTRLWESWFNQLSKNRKLVALTQKLSEISGYSWMNLGDDPELDFFEQVFHRGDFRISRGNKSVVLTDKQCVTLADEISRYVDMRLSSIFERGAW